MIGVIQVLELLHNYENEVTHHDVHCIYDV